MVDITGTNFLNVSAVSFGANAASWYSVNSPTDITAVAPAGTAGTVDITVATDQGISPTSSADRFTYVDVPTVTGLNPPAGPASGGQQIVISGTNFVGVQAVDFGSTPAASYTVVSSTQMNAVTPPGTAGSVVNVQVTTNSGTSAISTSDQYTYQQITLAAVRLPGPGPRTVGRHHHGSGPPPTGVMPGGEDALLVSAMSWSAVFALMAPPATALPA